MTDSTTLPTFDHEVPDGAPMVAPPLVPVEAGPRRSAAEEARTLLAGSNAGTLASLCDDGAPWASLVAYGRSTTARRCSSSRVWPSTGATSCASRAPASRWRRSRPATTSSPRARHAGGRGRAAAEELAALALERYIAAVPAAKAYSGFSDFTLWVLRVERVRWVGGYGRMASAEPGRVRARRSPTPSARARPTRSSTSTRTTPTRCSSWPRPSAATRTPRPPSATRSTATASTSSSPRPAATASPASASPSRPRAGRPPGRDGRADPPRPGPT